MGLPIRRNFAVWWPEKRFDNVNQIGYFPLTRFMIEKQKFPFVMSFPKKFNFFRNDPSYLMMYSDFVNTTIVGNVKAQLLKQIPVETHEKGYVTQEFYHKQYVSLLHTEITTLGFHIRGIDGNKVNFLDEEKNFKEVKNVF